MNAVEKIEPNQSVTAQPNVALTPMDMLGRAVSNGADIEILEKLMALNERWQAAEARKAFDEAVAAAKAEIPVIVRNATAHNNKRYADFAAIARSVDPVISKHGLSYRFRTTQTDKSITVTCVLFGHGHSEENTLSGPADTSGNKNAIQAIGSTLTYLQRYSLTQALGLAASNDDDGKAAGGAVTISADEAENLRDMLKGVGATEAKFIKWKGVEKIEDIRASEYDSCVDAIKGFRKGQAQ